MRYPRGERAATAQQLTGRTGSDRAANLQRQYRKRTATARQTRSNRAATAPAYTCRYMNVCISYTQCICDMDCLISRAYVRAYVSYMCFTYIHIYQSICVCMRLYVNGIQAHMHLIQPLSGSRCIQIHAYTCRYIAVCITYRPVHMRYGLPYIWCIC